MVAIKTKTTLSTIPITQTGLTTSLIEAFNNAGLGAAPFDQFTDGSSTNVLIYRIVNNAAAKGTYYLQVFITSALIVSCRVSEDWNPATNTSANNGGTSTTYTFSTGTQIGFTALNHPEFRGVCVEQATVYAILGVVRPANKRSWWTEDTYLYAFVPQNNLMQSLLSVGGTLSPYNASATSPYALALVPAMQLASPIPNQRDTAPSPILQAHSGTQGIAGNFGSDIILISSSGQTRLDIAVVTPDVEEYLLLNPSTNSGVGIRVV